MSSGERPQRKENQSGRQPRAKNEPRGPGSTVGERITGVRDPKDPDGLLTLDELPDPTGDVSDLSALIAKASRYGDDLTR
jgi:hypothetical protein